MPEPQKGNRREAEVFLRAMSPSSNITMQESIGKRNHPAWFPFRSAFVAALTMACLAFSLVGCRSTEDADPVSEDLIAITWEGSDPERVLRFYLGSFLGMDGGDPVSQRILVKRGNSWYLRPRVDVPEADPALKAWLESIAAQSTDRRSVDRDRFETLMLDSYYQARNAPKTLDALRQDAGVWSDESGWFSLEVTGSMSPYRRNVWVKNSALESALYRMNSLEDAIMYDVGTTFIGEHLDDGQVVETTVMRKRGDGFWDYFAYDRDGMLVSSIEKEPDNMLVPIQCTGCHYGTRLFEPERSFPAAARPGPRGERAVHVGEDLRIPTISSALQEHARRSDTILGLYATLYVSRALRQLENGTASEAQERMVSRLGFDGQSE